MVPRSPCSRGGKRHAWPRLLCMCSTRTLTQRTGEPSSRNSSCDSPAWICAQMRWADRCEAVTKATARSCQACHLVHEVVHGLGA